ncbi:hypothetical protein NPIL_300681 [Nephila pilipes]|uniref:Uncharacterized protein n=1 Tax=Nephila pilipes TaxID=299642 RepID=A0A8X6U444_NEPPI|nr:hypothetical protein NPIL_300681 [Nephila pilipes]
MALVGGPNPRKIPNDKAFQYPPFPFRRAVKAMVLGLSKVLELLKGKESLGDSVMSFKYSGPQVSRVQLRALACHYVHGGVQRVALTPWRLCDALFTRCLRFSFSLLDP